jgi:hypothetical protein
MTQLLIHISPRNRTPLRCAVWSLLILHLLASMPFAFHLINCAIDWIFGLLPQFHMPWQDEPL